MTNNFGMFTEFTACVGTNCIMPYSCYCGFFRSDTAVLQALASTVVNDVNIPYQHLESPQFWFNGPYTEETRHKLRM